MRPHYFEYLRKSFIDITSLSNSVVDVVSQVGHTHTSVVLAVAILSKVVIIRTASRETCRIARG